MKLNDATKGYNKLMRINKLHERRKQEFLVEYMGLTGVNEQEADAVCDEAALKQIDIDDIISMLKLGYQHEDIQSIIREESAERMIYIIATYGIRKFEEK